MLRRLAPISVSVLLMASPAAAQSVLPTDAPAATSPLKEEVSTTPLAQLDLFSPGEPSIAPDAELWKGADIASLRRALAEIAPRKGEAAANALAVRLLSTSARAPAGAESDPDLAADRVMALIRLGALDTASAILARTPGVASHAKLTRAAAELALWRGAIAEACALARSAPEGGDQADALSLRAFCLLQAGKASEAQLALDLAGTGDTAAAPVIKLLNAAALGQATGPGLADSGLSFAVSRAFKLDMAKAVATATPEALRQIARDEGQSPDIRRDAAAALLDYGPDMSGASAQALALPIPPIPVPTPPNPAKGRRKRAIAEAPPAEPRAQLLARLYGQLNSASDPAQSATAMLAWLKANAGAGFRGASALVADPLAKLDPALVPEPDRVWFRLAKAANGQDLKAVLDEVKPQPIAQACPPLETARWREILTALAHGVRGEAALEALTTLKSPGERDLAAQVLALTGFQAEAQGVTLDGLLTARAR